MAQFFARIGVATKVEALPPATLFTKATAREYALFMTSWTATIAATTLRNLAMTKNPELGLGPFNRQHYSNPELDRVATQAIGTLDDDARNRLVIKGIELLAEDVGMIPLLNSVNVWASRTDRASYDPSPLGRTQAMLATPAK